jgi:DNA-binding CsgD family transcriptional regulator
LSLGAVIEQRTATQSALLEALSAKADGVILLSRSGTPTFMNDAARKILASGDGLSFSKQGLVAQRGPETRRLQGLMQAALAASTDSSAQPGGHMMVTRRSGLRPYVVRVMPAPPVERFLARHGAACVIHIHDLAAARLPSKATLHAVFGLSERESDLAIELVRCASLADAAENARMAVNTARNHLQSIFRKTGTSSQADAVQLISRLP